jgi:hypothetical protein
MDKIETLTTLINFLSATSSDPSDLQLSNTGLQVQDGETWMPATREVWRSWTGPRAVWGIPFHGPIYSLHSKDDATPWDGPRVCSCAECQRHVAPNDRPN